MTTVRRVVVSLVLSCAPCVALEALDRDPVLLGRWPPFGGTGINAIAVEGDYAYCGTDAGLLIFEVGEPQADPLNSRAVGFYRAASSYSDPFLGATRALVVSGGHVYAGGAGGLVVIDVSEPAHPRAIGSHDSPFGVRDLAVSGGYAYVAGMVLEVLDVSDAASPRLVGEFSVGGGNFWDVTVAGQRAYVADQGFGLRVVDVTDPANPRQVGSLNDIVSAEEVVVAHGFAYVTSQNLGALVVDVRDPTTPELVRRFGPGFGNLAVSGNQLFGGRLVYDVSDPSDPRPLSSLEITSASGVRDLCVANGRAYLVGAAGLEVFDVRELAAPERVGGSDGSLSSPAELIFLAGNHAYLGGGGSLSVVDVSDPASPRTVGVIAEFPVVNERRLVPRDIFVAGNYAYVAGNRLLGVVDVSDPASPRQVGVFETDGRELRVWLVGQYAYLTAGVGLGRLLVIDVSDPGNPLLAGEAEIFRGNDLFVTDGFAYVVADGHLDVVDIADPRNPQVVGGFDAPFAGSAGGGSVIVEDNLAYLADGVTGLFILDVSDARSPQLVGELSTGESHPREMFVSGDFAYLAAGFDGLEVIDVSDPTAPRLIDRYASFGFTSDVAVSGNLAYVADGVTLQVIDTSMPPTAVAAVEVLETTIAVEDVAVEGDHAYVVDPGAGLHVFDVSDPSSPRRVGRDGNTRGRGREATGRVDVLASGTVVYVVDADGRTTVVEAIDVSDPRAPRSVGTYDSGLFGAWLSAVSSEHLYLVHGRVDDRGLVEARFVSIDIRDPTTFREVGEYVTAGEDIRGFVVSGDFAYLGVDDALELIDLGDPTTPRSVWRESERFGAPVVSGNRAYAFHDGAGGTGIDILDVSDPVHPTPLGRYAGMTHAPRFVSGTLVYADSYPGLLEDGFHLIDASDAARPRLVARWPNIAIKAVDGRHAYATEPDFLSRELRVLDVTPPANPQRVGAVEATGEPAERGGVVVAGSHAYVSEGESGLSIIDVRDPARPRRIGGLDTAGIAESVVVSGGTAYVADGFAGLQVIDVRNPASPQRLSEIQMIGGQEPSGYAYDVFLAGGNAYVPTWTSFTTGSLEIIDVRDPARPRRLGRLATSHVALTVVVSEDHAYVATAAGLEVVDVSDPATPRRVAALDVGDSPLWDIEVVEGHAYVAWPAVGLAVFDIGDPARPGLVGTYPLASAFSVDVSGDYAFVLDGLLGLEVIDVSDPVDLRRVAGNSSVITSPRPGGLAVMVQDGQVFVAASGDGFSVLELRSPFPPAGVSAQAGDGEVELSWRAPSGGVAPTGYDVYRVSPGLRVRVNGDPVTDTSVTIAGLENGLEYCFVVQSVSASGELSVDSAPSACAMPGQASVRFVRGDCNGDGRVAGQVTDAVYLLNYNFLGGETPPCLAACDANGDGRVSGQVTDAVYLLNYNFLGGAAPVAPFPTCGPGLSQADGELGCGMECQ